VTVIVERDSRNRVVAVAVIDPTTEPSPSAPAAEPVGSIPVTIATASPSPETPAPSQAPAVPTAPRPAPAGAGDTTWRRTVVGKA
jgi:hypothetical protein